MKVKLLLLAVSLCVTNFSYSQNEFITTWKTDNLGTSNDTSITIPTSGSGYNYDIDWNNDGTFDDFGVTGDITHDFTSAGTYTIRIQGDFPRISFNNVGDKDKIISIDQWGDIAWTGFKFYGCTNLTSNAIDVPDLSSVNNLAFVFAAASSFNGDLSNWDVSNITSMSHMFSGAQAFNGDISNWDVSSVTTMSTMFATASSFNGDLSNWDVSNVTVMNQMFANNSVFNGDISNWDVSSVTDMRSMFSGAQAFNGDLSNWNVSNVTDMGAMFFGTPFNSDISNWNVSNVTVMFSMFGFTTVFNGDLSSWDVSNVTDMSNMFNSASAFNGDISNWDVGSVTNMSQMFYEQIGTTVFNGDLSGWDVSNVTNMYRMFRDSPIFNGDISNWDVSSVTNMSGMFNASVFNQDLSSWDVSNVTDMSNMFNSALAFNGDISNWDVGSVTDMSGMFNNASAFNQDLGSWDVSNVTDMTSMFLGITLSTTNYDALLNGWNALALQNGVTFSGGNSNYCNGETARNNMTNTFGWTITDAGLDCSGLSTESFDANTISLYPNPSSGKVFLKYNTGENLKVFNMLGQRVYTTKLNTNLTTQEIDFSKFNSGIYLLKISDGNKVTTKHLVIK